MNIIIRILDIIHRPVLYLNTMFLRLNSVSETSCFKQKTERWIMSRIVLIILIYHRHKSIDSINLLGSYRRHNVFPVKYRQIYRVELSFK
jgi:hypothetical protein